MNDRMADVRRAHRLVVAYNRRLLDAVRALTDALRETHPGLKHLRTRPFRYDPFQEKHDPTDKWAWDFLPLAHADLEWASSTRPEAGGMYLAVRHTADSGFPEHPSGREPDPLAFPDATKCQTTLDPVVIVARGRLDMDWPTLFEYLEDLSGYKGWSDGEPHTITFRGVEFTYGGTRLDVADLDSPEAVGSRLVAPLVDLVRHGAGTQPSPSAAEPPWRAAQRVCRSCFQCTPALVYEGPEGRARPLFHEEGSLTARVLFILEAPNRGDTFDPDKGRMTIDPDTDPTGAFLWELMREAGLTPADVLFVNAAMCLPAAKDGKHPVTAALLARCVGHLATTIEKVRPEVVVPLGGPALRATARLEEHGLRKVTTAVGRPVPWRGRTLLPLGHPSALGRVSRSEALMREDWRALGRLLGTRQ